MKKTFLIFLLTLSSTYIFSQDVIITHEGNEISSKVIEITKEVIKYKKHEHLDGPIRNIDIIDVFMIIYEDGTREIFKKRKDSKLVNAETGKPAQHETNTFVDKRDDKEYKIVKIGNKWWFAENLAYERKTHCWPYKNDTANVSKYGYLYRWHVAKKVCPSGWELASRNDWEELFNAVGKDTKNLRDDKSVFWYGNQKESNNSGFSARGGGYYSAGGVKAFEKKEEMVFIGERSIGQWWINEGRGESYGYYVEMDSKKSELEFDYKRRGQGLSVRCVKK